MADYVQACEPAEAKKVDHACNDPCRVGLAHSLMDEDFVQIVKKKVTATDTVRAKPAAEKAVRISDRVKKAPLKS